jgi:zinc/manganese transport system substrate-binding protein
MIAPGAFAIQEVRMKTVAGAALLVILTAASLQPARAAGTKITIIAAENFYGDVASQIGGDAVAVKSIMSNPDQDPHLFETTPSVVRETGAAQIVIYNGADYDPWMEKLLKSGAKAGRVIINVADLVGKKPGDNPHLWYDPPTMPKVAQALASALSKADPSHRSDYAARRQAFTDSLKPMNEKIAAVASKYAGTPVTASEPVFGYMAAALKLKMRNEPFQIAVMNNTEPSARDVAAFQDDLKSHKVKVMFYNKQASDKIVQTLVGIAHQSKVPVVGVTETEPAGMTYQKWMLSELNDTEAALAGQTQ